MLGPETKIIFTTTTLIELVDILVSRLAARHDLSLGPPDYIQIAHDVSETLAIMADRGVFHGSVLKDIDALPTTDDRR